MLVSIIIMVSTAGKIIINIIRVLLPVVTKVITIK
jgi:hypothetical protein